MTDQYGRPAHFQALEGELRALLEPAEVPARKSEAAPAIRAAPARGVEIVINPAAGRQGAEALAHRLAAALAARGFVPLLRMVGPEGRPPAWVENGAAPPECLVCLGGDGTLDRIAEAAMRRQVPVVAAPVGFGNLTTQAFGYRREVGFIADLVERGRPLRVDVGLRARAAGMRPAGFLSVVAYGFIEDVKKQAEAGPPRRVRAVRMLAYLAAAGRWLVSRRAMTTHRVTVDGEVLSEAAGMVVVANVPAYPGQLRLTPTADPLDGKLDVCTISAGSRWTLVLSLLAIWLTGSANGTVRHAAGTDVEVTPRPEAGRSHRLTVRPAALTLLVPAVDERARPAASKAIA